MTNAIKKEDPGEQEEEVDFKPVDQELEAGEDQEMDIEEEKVGD